MEFCDKHKEISNNTRNTILDDMKKTFENEDMNIVLQYSKEMNRIVSTIAASDTKAEADLSNVKRDLLIVLKELNVPFNLTAFGSYVAGLGCKDSDFDFYFKLITDQPEATKVETLLNKSAEKLTKMPLFYNVYTIPYARVPIVRFRHNSTKKKCDLSFSSEIGVRNTLLTRWYLSINRNLKTLILFLKYLLKTYELHGPGKLSTYMLVWLVIFYMQQQDIVPPVMTVRAFINEPYIVQGWDCRIPNEFEHPIDDPVPLLFHVKGFLKFYSGFEFLKYVISPYLACKIPAEDFECLRIPQDAFSSYLEKIEKENEKFFINCINLQDPTEHNINLTKFICVDYLSKFKAFCYALYDFLNYHLKKNFKPNSDLKKMLPKELYRLPSWYSINNDVHQYMCLSISRSSFPPDLQEMFDKNAVLYISDKLQSIMQTYFKLEVHRSYTDNVKMIYENINVFTSSISCLYCWSETDFWRNICSKKCKYNDETDQSSIFLNMFIMISTPYNQEELRILIESEACFIRYLRSNLLTLLTEKKSILF